MVENLYFWLLIDKKYIKWAEKPQLVWVPIDFYRWTINEAVIIFVWINWKNCWLKDEYVKMAENLVKDYWVNVFVVGNPQMSRDDPILYLNSAMEFIVDEMENLWYTNYKFYGIGFWGWWYIMCSYMSSTKYSFLFNKMLIINPYLQEDFYEIIHGTSPLACPIIFIQWELDDYFEYNVKLNNFCQIKTAIWDDCQLFTLPWVDHYFTQEWWLELFISLPEKYLFND